MAPMPAAKASTNRAGTNSNSSGNNTTANNSSAAAAASTASPAFGYPDLLELEEKQAAGGGDGEGENCGQVSDLPDDHQFASTCRKVQDVFDRMLKLKNEVRNAPAVDNGGDHEGGDHGNGAAELRAQFAVLFVDLKKLNRLDKLKTRKIRDATSAAKAKVDTCNLELQNLRYELMHLENEIDKCLQFRSADEDIDLVPLEEFRAAATERGHSDDPACDHKLRLARLDLEDVQRQEMAQELRKLEAFRKDQAARIRDKRSGLAGLRPQLSSILKKTGSLQEYLEMPLDRLRGQRELARYLPQPLFLLYSEISAYGHAGEPAVAAVKILGDLDEAKAFNLSSQRDNRRRGEGLEDYEDDEDDDKDDVEEDEDEDPEDDRGGRKGKKKGPKASRKRVHDPAKFDREDYSSSSAEQAALDELLLAVHPLTVTVTIQVPEGPDDRDLVLQLTFSYLTRLEFVTVKTSLTGGAVSGGGSGGKDVLQADSLLAHLMDDGEDDDGRNCPNPVSAYIIKKRCPKRAQPPDFRHLGAAFTWAQTLAGFSFPSSEAGPDDDKEVEAATSASAGSACRGATCRTQIQEIVCRIKERVTARVALARQLAVLEKAKAVDGGDHAHLPVPPEFRLEFPAKVQSKVRAWYPVDWEQYSSLDVTRRHLVARGAVGRHDFLFRLQLNRDPPPAAAAAAAPAAASLIALVAVGPNYPHSPPVFCLNLHWDGGEYHQGNCERIRALERHVNTCYRHLLCDKSTVVFQEQQGAGGTPGRHQMLSLQVKQLMLGLDVLLEAWNTDKQQHLEVDLLREKLFLQPVRGRKRAPPLKYQHQLQLFTQ